MTSSARARALLVSLALVPGPASAWQVEQRGAAESHDRAMVVAAHPSGDVLAGGWVASSPAGEAFSLARLSGATGAELWRVLSIAPAALAVDAAGDVLVAGVAPSADPANVADFALAKHAGATGEGLWVHQFGPGLARANALAVDSAGDALAAGSALVGRDILAAASRFVVAKVAGSTGAELWRRELPAGPDLTDGAFALAVDGAGDVLAGGEVWGAFTVVKLAGEDGEELWRREIPEGRVRTLAVDACGDVLAGGSIIDEVAEGSAPDFAVLKLSGSDGSVRWRYAADGGVASYDEVLSLVVDGAGDVLAGGVVIRAGSGQDFSVAKLAGGSGQELWLHVAPNAPPPPELEHVALDDRARALAVDGAGTVFAAGDLDFAYSVLALSGASGQQVWRRQIEGPGDAYAVAVDGAGDVLAAGALWNDGSGYDFLVSKWGGPDGSDVLCGAGTGPCSGGPGEPGPDACPPLPDPDPAPPQCRDGLDNDGDGLADHPLDRECTRRADRSEEQRLLAGAKLVLMDREGRPSRRKLVLLSKDPGIAAADPARGGGWLRLANPATGQTADFALPASGWRALGNPPGSRGYKYWDGERANGPCKLVLVNPQKLLRAVCQGREIDFSLAESAQGSLSALLELGDGPELCLSFGGTVVHDRPARGTKKGLFMARGAPAPPRCPLP